MINVLNTAWVIAKKDLQIEARSKEIVLTTALFAALLVILSALSFYIDPQNARQVAPGALWLAILFSGVLIMSRSWVRESQDGAFWSVLMSPASSTAIYLGKLLSTWVFLTIVELVTLPLIAMFFQIDLLQSGLPLLAIITLGSFGFVASGTLFSAIVVRSQARDLMLSVVVFPLVAPALLAAAVATRELFSGAAMSDVLGWIRILLAFDLVVFAAGTVLFGYLIRE